MAHEQESKTNLTPLERRVVGWFVIVVFSSLICSTSICSSYNWKRINVHGPYIYPLGSTYPSAIGVEIPLYDTGPCSPSNAQMAKGLDIWLYAGHPYVNFNFGSMAASPCN